MDSPAQDSNPTPLQTALERVSNLIDEESAAAHSRFAQPTDKSPFDLQARVLQYLIELFDIHAHHHKFLILSYQAARGWYEPYLKKLTDNIITHAEKMTSGWVNAPTGAGLDGDDLKRDLRVGLIGRCSHWKAEGLKRAREIEAEERATAESGEPSTPLSISAEAPPANRPVDIDRIKAERHLLLAEYKEATNNPSSRQIYEARNSGIHKPDFYSWLNGKLSAESAMSINFERFLRLKKPPLPKLPKG